MKYFRHLSLRWHLIIAFFLVSAPPVLVSSYSAATVISGVFQRNIEQWLEGTALFLAADVEETKNEADKSAGIIASALSRSSSDAPISMTDSVTPFAGLLASGGYDFIQIYDEKGNILFKYGNFELVSPPLEDKKALLRVNVGGSDILIGAAIRSFYIKDQKYFILIADKIDGTFSNSSQAVKSLDIALFQVSAEGAIGTLSTQDAVEWHVPKRIFLELMSGQSTAVSRGLRHRGLTAYAALHDNNGNLIGIIACRVAGMAAMFENMDEWQFFLMLSTITGIFSILVGALIARWISRPVRALTIGLRSVAAGDYHGRLKETGGSELSELAAGFNLMNEQLERLRNMEVAMRKREQLAALGEAAVVIAHEIRNPLGIINTSSQVIRMKSKLNPSEDKLIEFIMEEVNRIDNLVKDILDFSRPRELNKHSVDLVSEIVTRVVDFTAPVIEERKLTCSFTDREVYIDIFADADKLYQAFLNLILNAIEATPDGGHLNVMIAKDGDFAKISIENSGEGISPDIQERMFDPFFTTKAKGIGLGLAQAKTAIEEHGGTISCVSEKEKGTTFTVILPRIKSEVPDETGHTCR